MRQSALSQPRKMTVQIATIGICTVFAPFVVDISQSEPGCRVVGLEVNRCRAAGLVVDSQNEEPDRAGQAQLVYL